MGFEDKDNFPHQMEFDEWDDHAVHFIVRHRYSGHWLGALRIVSQNNFAFPFEEKCLLDQKITQRQYQHSMELSRLCVIKDARRFAPVKYAPYGLIDEELVKERGNVKYLYNHKNQSRSIMWGLIRAAVVYSAKNDIKHLYFLIASSLAYYVKKEGFAMRKVGDACNHRGERTPYQLEIDHILANPFWLTDYKKGFRKYSELATELPNMRRVGC